MTVTTLTCIAAPEHINDLLRDAEAGRRAGELRATHRIRRSLSQLFARGGASVVEPEPTVIAAQRVVRVQPGH